MPELPFRTVFFPSDDYKSSINHSFYRDFLNESDIDIVINQCGAHGDSILYNNVSSTKAKVISVLHLSPSMNLNNYWSKLATLKNDTFKEHVKRIGRLVLFQKLKRDYKNRLKGHYRWLFVNTDKICLLSNRVRSELAELAGDNYDASKVVTINNPIVIPNQPSSKPEREKIILWVGRFDLEYKRPDLCLKIWKRISKTLPDWQLIMVGDGKDLNYIKGKARGLERITFTGYADPEPYYDRAKILILTSQSEGWGMVLTEAMSHGVVPMAFDSFLAVRDIINDETRLVTPFDTEEYSRKILSLAQSPETYANALRDMTGVLDKFSLSRTVDKWENTFSSLVK